MSLESDNELMLRVKRGETDALGELFELHHLQLYNFFLKMCGNRHRSEDMVQDTFVKILKYALGYRGDGAFLPWMFKIARNTYIDSINSEKRKFSENRRDHDYDVDHSEAFHSDPEYIAGMEDRQRRMQQALLRLPAEKREIILLARVKQVSISELADIYQCSIAAMKVRLHRALTLLRSYYDQDTTVDSNHLGENTA